MKRVLRIRKHMRTQRKSWWMWTHHEKLSLMSRFFIQKGAQTVCSFSSENKRVTEVSIKAAASARASFFFSSSMFFTSWLSSWQSYFWSSHFCFWSQIALTFAVRSSLSTHSFSHRVWVNFRVESARSHNQLCW